MIRRGKGEEAAESVVPRKSPMESGEEEEGDESWSSRETKNDDKGYNLTLPSEKLEVSLFGSKEEGNEKVKGRNPSSVPQKRGQKANG